MSTELVSRDSARAVYNSLNGTDLEAHRDNLTAEQAELINSQFDIELRLGAHGIVRQDKSTDNKFSQQPVEQDYEEAAQTVASLQPGDILFMENYGFSHNPSPPQADEMPAATDDQLSISEMFKRTVGPMLSEQLKQHDRAALEQKRKAHTISAWAYAYELARLKGVQTIFADQDAFEAEANRALANGKTARELHSTLDPSEQALAWRIHGQREQKVVNTVKDWALQHLAEDINPNTPKRKLVILFGSAHRDGLERAFSNLGLNATTTLLAEATTTERLIENAPAAIEEDPAAATQEILEVAKFAILQLLSRQAMPLDPDTPQNSHVPSNSEASSRASSDADESRSLV